MGAEGDAVKQHEQEEHAQVQPEIDEGGHVFGQQKQVLRHIHLGENVCVCQQGMHSSRRGFPVIGEHQVAAEEVDGVVGGVPAEELGEHQTHDQQIQQGRHNAPTHAQYGAFVFLFEVALGKFLHKELILNKLILNCF